MELPSEFPAPDEYGPDDFGDSDGQAGVTNKLWEIEDLVALPD